MQDSELHTLKYTQVSNAAAAAFMSRSLGLQEVIPSGIIPVVKLEWSEEISIRLFPPHAEVKKKKR